jgi:hypothetical protein
MRARSLLLLVAAVLAFWPVSWPQAEAERFTATLAEGGATAAWRGAVEAGQAPLYYLAARLVDAESTRRALSALVVLVALVVTARAARRRLDEAGEIAVLAFFAVGVVPVAAAHAATPDAAALLCGALALHGAVTSGAADPRLAREGRWALTAATIGATWFALPALVAAAAAWGVAAWAHLRNDALRARRAPLGGALAAAVAAAAPFALGPLGAAVVARGPTGASTVLVALFPAGAFFGGLGAAWLGSQAARWAGRALPAAGALLAVALAAPPTLLRLASPGAPDTPAPARPRPSLVSSANLPDPATRRGRAPDAAPADPEDTAEEPDAPLEPTPLAAAEPPEAQPAAPPEAPPPTAPPPPRARPASLASPGPRAAISPSPVAPAETPPTTPPPAKGAAAPAAAPAATADDGGPARSTFTFADGLPDGWITEGKVLAHAPVVVVGDGNGTVSLLCTPFVPVSGEVRGSITRAFVVPEGESETWSRVEARAFGRDKKALPGAKPTLLTSLRAGATMAATPFAWTPPEGAAFWRLCTKTGGAARGSTVVKEITLR